MSGMEIPAAMAALSAGGAGAAGAGAAGAAGAGAAGAGASSLASGMAGLAASPALGISMPALGGMAGGAAAAEAAFPAGTAAAEMFGPAAFDGALGASAPMSMTSLSSMAPPPSLMPNTPMRPPGMGGGDFMQMMGRMNPMIQQMMAAQGGGGMQGPGAPGPRRVAPQGGTNFTALNPLLNKQRRGF